MPGPGFELAHRVEIDYGVTWESDKPERLFYSVMITRYTTTVTNKTVSSVQLRPSLDTININRRSDREHPCSHRRINVVWALAADKRPVYIKRRQHKSFE
jgi:hypothetical protein